VTEVKVGQVVESIAGRDKGFHMIVYGIIDNEYVTVVDGRHRRVENPKKKKLKHLHLTPKVASRFVKNIQTGIVPTNEEVREYLDELVGPDKYLPHNKGVR